MPPKKQNRSPFGLFMMKMKITNKDLNRKPMDQIVSYCNEIYKTLNPEVLKRFDALSQLVRNNGLQGMDLINRLNKINIYSTSNDDDDSGQNWDKCEVNFSYTKLQNKTKEEIVLSDEDSDEDFESDYEKVKKAIKNDKNFETSSVIVISFNVSVRTIDGKFYPNEVGLTKFSLFDGIQDIYHKLIYNEIPDGYYSSAKEHSESTHKIPLNPRDNRLYEQNYEMIFNEIYEFMAESDLIDSKGKKLVFCKTVDSEGSEDKPHVIGCLKWLANEAAKLSNNSLRDKKVSDFDVIDLSELLFVLIQKYSSGPRPKNLIIDDLSKCVYDYYTNISCNFHEEIENKFCALGVSKRLSYLLFDSFFLHKKPEIEIKPNENHRPKEQKTGSIEISNFKFRDVKTYVQREDRYHSCHDSDADRQTLASTSTTVPGIRKPYTSGIGRGRIHNNLKKMNQ